MYHSRHGNMDQCTKMHSCELPVFKKFEPLSNLFQLLHNAAIVLEGNQEIDDRD